MRLSVISAAVAALASVVSARVCTNLTVPVTVAARNGIFSVATPDTNIDVTNFVLDLTQQGKNYTSSVLAGVGQITPSHTSKLTSYKYKTVNGTYMIGATYCRPNSGPGSVVQLLTHGIGFDRSYWDFSYNAYNYSYVKEAVDKYGYSTFAWDRLGIGRSSRADPIQEVQAWLEVSALHALTQMLRAGSIPGVTTRASKVIQVGHSFGSQHAYALSAMYPRDSDGLVLTGFSQNGSFVPYFALGANLIQANTISALSSYPKGYLANASPTGVQIDFFAPRQFDPQVLSVAYNTGQPVTVGELLTIGGETGSVNNFKGPVLVVTGERDVPYCGGNCYGTGGVTMGMSAKQRRAALDAGGSIPAMSKMNYPNATDFQASIIPGAGHGLNLEYSHPTTYSIILNYLINHGLGPQMNPTSSMPPSSSGSMRPGASSMGGGAMNTVSLAGVTGPLATNKAYARWQKQQAERQAKASRGK